MNKPTCALWDKDYAEQWKAWIKSEIDDNKFGTIEDCMSYIMTEANGRVNPSIVKSLYQEYINK